ncbi:double-stranded RNA-binding protein Staufen homolog [Elysia marginata]|uniref:Double-stranded RNA-binding protein Staufen homolog n=1 Tax=Elysia marginata TaxID=1093978 RepID=A0AAV4I444_9GAST|nr:double-stranded RNA-binding protein Staufen homolog [Elysia marginata]
MNSQQQHSMLNPVTAASVASQRTMMAQQQRGNQQMNLQNSAYQQLQQPSAPAVAQMSHFQQGQSQQMQAPAHQQQPLMVSAAYQKASKHQQNGSEVRHVGSQPYPGIDGGRGITAAQNGNHHPLGLEGQNSFTHQQTNPYHQHSQLQQYQQLKQPAQKHQQLVSQHYQHQQPSATQQHEHQLFQHHHHHHQLHNQQQQPQLSPHVQQTTASYKQAQIQQHVEQRSFPHQHQRHHHKQQQLQSQPKQILQNPSHAKSAASPNLGQQQSKPQEPEPLLIIDTFSADGETEQNQACGADHSEVEEKSDNIEETKSNGTSDASEEHGLANTKEKTPMCLINELARYNKVSHQYTLVDEQGPAHKKIFYVKLKLGDEEYSASGESIKKAQHAAAAIALKETRHTHPPPKPPRFTGQPICHTDENITPTVELNALAMKRGEATTYKAIEPQQPPYYPQPGMDYRGIYGQRYHQYMRASRDPRYRGGVLWPLRCHYVPRAFYVSLRVGHREFIGDGPTRQAARHNAAQKALRILKHLPDQNEPKENPAPSEQAEEDVADGETLDVNDSLKSEISLVHELALRRNMLVTFEVIKETGPPHMKTFVTRCCVSDKVTDGEGNSKKASKKKAAELMLEELQKLPAAPPAYVRPKCKVQLNKKKNRNIIKSELQQQKADPNYGVGINPISRLIQIMQAQKKKEPVYTLVSERGLPRRREFLMQVEVEDKSCTGSGPNKKLAKRAAAEAMLLILGYTKPSPQPAKSSIKTPSGEGSHSNGDKKVTFVGDTSESDKKAATPVTSQQNQVPAPVQRVPGLLHLPPSATGRSPLGITAQAPSRPVQSQPREPLINLASILKPSLRPELQLRELCKALDQDLEIDDFTKKRPSGTEHITRITVGKEPGQTQSFHGSSNTLESSRDMAALDALKMLLGKVKEVHPAGDGPQVKKELLTRSSLSLRKEAK